MAGGGHDTDHGLGPPGDMVIPIMKGNYILYEFSSGQVYPQQPTEEVCEEVTCKEEYCACQHQVALSLGKIIQFNIAVTVTNARK